MNTLRLLVLGMAAFAAAAPTTVAADSYWDVEAARANARAGGPTNPHDAELLERYGCLSGTRSRFCERLAGNGNGGQRYYYRHGRRYAR